MKKPAISIRNKLILLSVLLLLGSGNIAYITYKHTDKQASSKLWIEHTEEVINCTDNILSLHKDLEASTLEYIITKDSSFVEEFMLARRRILSQIAKAKQLTPDNYAQQVRIDSLNFFLHKYLDYSLVTIAMRATDIKTAIDHSSANEDKKNEYNIQKTGNSIKQEELALLKQRIQINELSIAAYSQYLIAIYIIILTLAILIVIAAGKYLVQNIEKRKNAFKLSIANKSIVHHLDEKQQRAAELIIANNELVYQNKEKLNRAEELIIANKELVYQNKEKENRAAELVIANTELVYQNTEKENRAAELAIANTELAYQNTEKENRAAELIVANMELVFQNREKGNRAAELLIANKELVYNNIEKENRADELIIANKELLFQNSEKEKRAAELVHANQLYAFLSQINQTIVHSPDEQTVFKEACRIAVDLGKFSMAWIGRLDKEKKMIHLAEQCGMRDEDIPMLQNVPYIADDHHGLIIETGQSYIANNIATDPQMVNWVSFAATRGWKSCMSLPIKISGTIIAVFTIVSYDLGIFQAQEIALLEESVNDISFALAVFEKEQHRKEMEDKIAHSELRLKQAQAIGHFGSWELNLATGLGEWSEEFCNIYGVATHDNFHTYQSWHSFIHPDDLEYVRAITDEGKRTSTNFAYHHRIILKNGAIKHLYSQTHFTFNESGEQTGLHGVAHDITEMKEIEAERAKMTADIVQRNKDLEQFSYIVSHNLRAPVANILGLVNVLQTMEMDQRETIKATGYLSVAARNLDRVIIDINSILELNYNVQEKREIIKFADLLDEIKYSFDDLIADELLEIRSDFSSINGIVALKSYMHSIFFNLVSNSIKYRQPGIKPVVEIKSSIDNNTIRLVFKDNGLGIDMQQNGEKLFGLYKRFHDHVDGKGMGLYMVRAQVESMGGTISVTSEVNKGTEFCIEFENG